MPSLYRDVSDDTNMFTRLKLAATDYEGLATDLTSFISKSVLDKMDTVRGGGSREHGSTLGELRRVSRSIFRETLSGFDRAGEEQHVCRRRLCGDAYRVSKRYLD